ncbi:hypothetical protein AB1N83_011986 [Pleurotus pulmonarius]
MANLHESAQRTLATSGPTIQDNGNSQTNTNNSSGTFNNVRGEQYLDSGVIVVGHTIFFGSRRDGGDDDYNRRIESLETRVQHLEVTTSHIQPDARLQAATEGAQPNLDGDGEGPLACCLWQTILAIYSGMRGPLGWRKDAGHVCSDYPIELRVHTILFTTSSESICWQMT